MNINDDVASLKGIGPKTKELLNKCGIYKILDLLLYFPRDYEKIHYCNDISNLKDEDKVIIKAKVKEIKKDIYVKRNMVISTVIFTKNDLEFQGKWFNQKYIKNKFKVNEEYIISGKVKMDKYKVSIINPNILEDTEKLIGITPKYSLKGSLTNNFFNKTINYILSNITIVENIPKNILDKYNLVSLDKSIRNIHHPTREEELLYAMKRLKFQELFTYSLKLLMLKQYKKSKGIAFKISEELKILKENLPFTLTDAQNKVVREILIDEKRDRPMNRLVQGDVGSGKTIVSLIALFNIVKNGYQGVLMAPTEILANQHYEQAINLFENFNVKIELLTGSTKKKDIIKGKLKSGEVDMVIGTHALLEDDVEFNNLGMVVTDEQHRFGVKQRSKLYNKNNNIDVLVMTATPIPRTLALSLYGDLDISTIDKLPPGRKKIDTFSVKENERNRVYNFALKKIKQGAQVYIVCPLVEENEELNVKSVEKLYMELKDKYFNNVEVEILHGKMPSKSKDEIMERFKMGKTEVLISTTVIEVGVNVPNATLMIIESAERFGLSQLHQLRGRVGRGDKKSYCILITNSSNDITKQRMDIITKSNDGFFIAEEDLKLRGSGEIFGFNQHGENGFIISDVINDYGIFRNANKEAKILIKSEKKEDIQLKNNILDEIKRSSRYICFN
ncbi:ATP-dependent DNA helicase RecG [Clostridium botulinum]|uniref:ATP-dependent DNA helicase RecG n=3 Tax=Clostridium botulinum TaxID=1491 RepID=A0A9Q1V0Q0_CLOBO|nr:ATP-dependent DNA helicase RecG [Clostridium botulinum]AEB76168.1 ATP-dependent DNA helicase RecG [Clostridium botulinum BKT015925]KEH97767.1 ATP-dependent DNA helicase RecG [Clostridium botulinum D str. 16868]KEI05553.1 ATP-dependent DNA helicase RecG [Clostridium botulinum C/D str. Sp77]KLU76636.1 ATP-dependent DNA helicase RecG [Clostridium botulinum V891]KOA76021.1 ATP-dependent DNA helicase RecG [Clostridium botulinum]